MERRDRNPYLHYNTNLDVSVVQFLKSWVNHHPLGRPCYRKRCRKTRVKLENVSISQISMYEFIYETNIYINFIFSISRCSPEG